MFSLSHPPPPVLRVLLRLQRVLRELISLSSLFAIQSPEALRTSVSTSAMAFFLCLFVVAIMAVVKAAVSRSEKLLAQMLCISGGKGNVWKVVG